MRQYLLSLHYTICAAERVCDLTGTRPPERMLRMRRWIARRYNIVEPAKAA